MKFHEVPDGHKHRQWFLIRGISLIVLGILALGFSHMATEFTVILLGIFLALAGIVQMVSGFYAIRWSGFSFSLLMGLFYFFVGAICIFKPMPSAMTLSLLIAILLLMGGAIRLVTALRYHYDHWTLAVFNGAVAVLLGLLILAEWPASSIWVIGLFVGVDLVLMGGYWVWLSLALKK